MTDVFAGGTQDAGNRCFRRLPIAGLREPETDDDDMCFHVPQGEFHVVSERIPIATQRGESHVPIGALQATDRLLRQPRPLRGRRLGQSPRRARPIRRRGQIERHPGDLDLFPLLPG